MSTFIGGPDIVNLRFLFWRRLHPDTLPRQCIAGTAGQLHLGVWQWWWWRCRVVPGLVLSCRAYLGLELFRSWGVMDDQQCAIGLTRWPAVPIRKENNDSSITPISWESTLILTTEIHWENILHTEERLLNTYFSPDKFFLLKMLTNQNLMFSLNHDHINSYKFTVDDNNGLNITNFWRVNIDSKNKNSSRKKCTYIKKLSYIRNFSTDKFLFLKSTLTSQYCCTLAIIFNSFNSIPPYTIQWVLSTCWNTCYNGFGVQ